MVFGPFAPKFVDGKCNTEMKDAIAAFQRVWGGPSDSTVDPGGRTLSRLDRLAHPVVLQPIELDRVRERRNNGKVTSDGGGYKIAFLTCDGDPLPPPGRGYGVFLVVMNDANAIDVTARPPNDLLSQGNVGDLLRILDNMNLWGIPVQCRVQVRYRGAVITTSNSKPLQAPVVPHNGKMLPLDQENNGAKLTYQGDPEAKDFHGRMFAEVPGFRKNLFVYGGMFETRNEFRGFDCITYAGTACGASTSHMAASADLAESLQSSPVTVTHKKIDPKSGKQTTVNVQLEKADPSHVKAFFAAKPDGYFLMWSGGHIVIVANGWVHEFKHSAPSGYAQTNVTNWLEPYHTSKLTVRRLQEKPVRAT
jgi:hypothetical protein